MKFLLYGAYGYTGKIIAECAAQYGLTPILAGRNAEKLKPLAAATGYAFKVLDLGDAEALRAALSEVALVLHAAGPFIHTAQPMLEACLATKTHYLDITGEAGVFEALKKQDQRAKQAGILVLPGAGFDVVPTDCLANALKRALPESTDLKLAFWTIGGGVSHGTAITMTENLGKGSWVRKNGHLRPVPLGHKTLWIHHEGKRRLAMTFPWGDISTAYTSTGIPNIETYKGVHPKRYQKIRYLKYINWLLRLNWVRKMAQRRVDKAPAGPTAEQRANGACLVWGQVTDPDGQFRQGILKGPEGYDLTAHSSLIIARKVLEGRAPTGYHTPVTAFGPELVLEIPGVEWKLGPANTDLSGEGPVPV